MTSSERRHLLAKEKLDFELDDVRINGLTVFFAVICVVDVFGVFPIVTLPKPIILCGWFGIPLILFVFGLQIYTATLLGSCWLMAEKLDKNIVVKNRYPYAAIAEMTYGTNISKLVTILLDITVFGGGVPNLLVASQNLQLLGVRLSDDKFDFSFCYWLIILGTVICPFLWMGSPKDMTVLCSISVTTVLSVCIMIWVCIIRDQSNDIPPQIILETTIWENIVSAYGIIAFQFDIHPMLLTIHVDMKNKEKISWVVISGFAVTGLMFVITTIIAYFKYGVNTHSNILQGLSPSIPLYITVMLVTLQLCMTSAVGNSALYQHVEDYFSVPRDFNIKRCLVRTTLTVLAVLVAESVPRFDLVMSLIGGTLTGPLVFIFPPLFYIKMLSLQRKHNSRQSVQNANRLMYHNDTDDEEIITEDACSYGLQKSSGPSTSTEIYTENRSNCRYLFKMLTAISVIAFGLLATVFTTYSNISDTVKYANFYPPCLFNITAASLANF